MVSDATAPVKSRQLGRRRPKLLSLPTAETPPMAAYKDRVSKDLDRWITAGLVPEGSRAPILAAIPDPRRLDAAAALAWVGAVLLGIAVIAFVSANWDALPRIARFALLLGVFAAGAGA